jgi:hypothetical protein
MSPHIAPNCLGAPLQKNSANKAPSLSPEDASHDFTRKSMRIEFLLPHPPHNPDLAPSDSQLFGPLKEALRGRRFADDDDELKHSVPEEPRCFGKEFSGTSIQRFAQR